MSHIVFEFNPKDIKYLINHNFLKRKSKFVSSLMSYKILFQVPLSKFTLPIILVRTDEDFMSHLPLF